MRGMRITYDFTWLHKDAIGERGVSSQELAALEQAHPHPWKQILQNPYNWPLGWLDLEARTAELSLVRQALARIENRNVLVTIGMGGSTLGTKALAATFVRQTGPSSFSAGERELIVVDNLDEATTAEVIHRAGTQGVVLNPVSKSGNTLETIANFLALSQRPALADSPVVVTTGNRDGALATYARETGAPVLPVPGDVGGRFSALSPVSLFPLGFLGYPIEDLLEGATAARSNLTADDYESNPSLRLAARLHLLATRRNFSELMLWIYCDALREFGRWWEQLFAESLGKQKQVASETVRVGLTPLAVSGPAAQHSLLQLALDGPPNKISGFTKVAQTRAELPALSHPPRGVAEFNYLQGRHLHEIASAELEGTRSSLRHQSLPSYLLILQDLQPEVLGELILFFETAIAVMGVYLSIDPYTQPAVEESKQLARKLLQQSPA